jgi:hypothetical protein
MGMHVCEAVACLSVGTGYRVTEGAGECQWG